MVTIHVKEKALLWHQSYMKIQDLQGTIVSWEDYSASIRSRFGDGTFYDPILELKNLKQQGPVTSYYRDFTSVVQLVDDPRTEWQVQSLFVGGLKPELLGPAHMIQPKFYMMHNAFSLAKLQDLTCSFVLKPTTHPFVHNCKLQPFHPNHHQKRTYHHHGNDIPTYQFSLQKKSKRIAWRAFVPVAMRSTS